MKQNIFYKPEISKLQFFLCCMCGKKIKNLIFNNLYDFEI